MNSLVARFSRLHRIWYLVENLDTELDINPTSSLGSMSLNQVATRISKLLYTSPYKAASA